MRPQNNIFARWWNMLRKFIKNLSSVCVYNPEIPNKYWYLINVTRTLCRFCCCWCCPETAKWRRKIAISIYSCEFLPTQRILDGISYCCCCWICWLVDAFCLVLQTWCIKFNSVVVRLSRIEIWACLEYWYWYFAHALLSLMAKAKWKSNERYTKPDSKRNMLVQLSL